MLIYFKHSNVPYLSFSYPVHQVGQRSTTKVTERKQVVYQFLNFPYQCKKDHGGKWIKTGLSHSRVNHDAG